MGEETRATAGVDRLRAIWRRRTWLLLGTFAVPCAASLSLLVALPNVYQSSATVIVDRQQVPEEFVRPTVTSTLETRIQTISQEILSRSRLEALIQRFGLYANLRQHQSSEQVTERMRQDIQLELKHAEVRERRVTVAFAIRYTGGDPQTVAQVTNTLASFYIEENLKARERQATGTAEFLKVQLDETKKRLDVQEARVSEFKKQFVGELPQDREVNLATLERLNAQLRLNLDSQARAIERREAAAKQMAEAGFAVGPTGPGAMPPDPTAVHLARLRQELTELKTRFSERYPDVVRLRAEIAAVEEAAASGKPVPAPGTGQASLPPDPQFLRMKQAVAEADADVKVLKAEEGRLREAIGTYQQRVLNTPRREQEFRELARDYDATRELYDSLLKRYAEAQIAESMEQRQKGEQFRILDPAVPSDEPAGPKRPRLVGLALALSAGLALGAVLLAEQLDTSFHTLDDLRAVTSLPVAASIPRIVTDRDRRRRRRRIRLGGLLSAVGLVAIVVAAYLVGHGNERLVTFLLAGPRP